MVGGDGDELRVWDVILPLDAVGFVLRELRRGLAAVPDDLGHLHDLLPRLPLGHGEELVSGLADFERVRVRVGPLGGDVDFAAASPDARNADRGVEEGPEVVSARGLQPLVGLRVQVVPPVAALPEPAVVRQEPVVFRDHAVAGEVGEGGVADAVLAHSLRGDVVAGELAERLPVVLVEAQVRPVPNLGVYQRRLQSRELAE